MILIERPTNHQSNVLSLFESVVKNLNDDEFHIKNLPLISTERFTDLGKLNLHWVVGF